METWAFNFYHGYLSHSMLLAYGSLKHTILPDETLLTLITLFLMSFRQHTVYSLCLLYLNSMTKPSCVWLMICSRAQILPFYWGASWSVSPSHPAGLKNKYFWIFMFWFAFFSTPKLINSHTQPHYFSCKICFPKEFSPFFLINSFSAESELLILAVLTGGHRSQTCLQHSSASLPSS